MSFFWRKCETIMLKNLLVRKRHWLFTLFEILCSLALFLLLCYKHNEEPTKPKKVYPMTFHNYMAEIDMFEEITCSSHESNCAIHIAYTPVTPFTKKLMKRLNSTSLINHLRNSKKFGK